MNEEIKNRIKRLIAEKIRPGIVMDGGDIELVEILDDGVVRVRLLGACAHCPFSSMTLASGVEQSLKELVPEVSRVEMVP
ncbi:MAG: NifU family protein [bacterium]